MAKQPTLPLYYNDISRTCSTWSDEEFGCYIRLLMEQWDKGHIPKELHRLARIATSIEKNWPLLKDKFSEHEGVLKNKRMEEIRGEIKSFSKKQSQNAKKKWEKEKSEKKPQPKQSEPTIDIWKENEMFLCQDEIWFQQEIIMKYRGVDKETLKFYLTQYWLKCQRENKQSTLQQLRAGLKSYINSCEQTKKENKNGKSTGKKSGHDLSEAEAAARQVLAEYNRNKERGGRDIG